MTSFSALQSVIRQYELDAWVLYDFRGSNSIAWHLLGLPADAHCTRRWMIVIPANGAPVKIVHTMEHLPLSHIDAQEVLYSRKEEWEHAVQTHLAPYATIAMEYSPHGDIPVISKVDAGTVEWIRSLGHNIVSSANLAQEFTAVWSDEQLSENLQTAEHLRNAMMYGFEFIRHNTMQGRALTEYDVQTAILERFAVHHLTTDFPPIVAVNGNAANPHYAPTAEQHSPIVHGDVVLIDMWAKTANPTSTFADITWMGYVGDTVPERVQNLFAVIRDARDAVVRECQRRLDNSEPLRGCDLDDIARAVVENAGYGAYFFHRTGHNITTEIHGPGANLDNYETRDTRLLLPMTSFSVEPGLYLKGDVGLRTELDVIITKDRRVLIPTEPIQTRVFPLLADNWQEQGTL